MSKGRKVDIKDLWLPKAFAKMMGVTPPAVTKQMNEKRVDVIEINGGRIINYKKEK